MQILTIQILACMSLTRSVKEIHVSGVSLFGRETLIIDLYLLKRISSTLWNHVIRWFFFGCYCYLVFYFIFYFIVLSMIVYALCYPFHKLCYNKIHTGAENNEHSYNTQWRHPPCLPACYQIMVFKSDNLAISVLFTLVQSERISHLSTTSQMLLYNCLMEWNWLQGFTLHERFWSTTLVLCAQNLILRSLQGVECVCISLPYLIYLIWVLKNTKFVNFVITNE